MASRRRTDAAASAVRRGDLVVRPRRRTASAPTASAVRRASRCSPRRVAAATPTPPVLVGSPSTLDGLTYAVSSPAGASSRRSGPAPSPSSCATRRASRGTSATPRVQVALRMPCTRRPSSFAGHRPLAVTSANVAGLQCRSPRPTRRSSSGDAVAVYLDAGRSPEGLQHDRRRESARSPFLLRAGAVPWRPCARSAPTSSSPRTSPNPVGE